MRYWRSIFNIRVKDREEQQKTIQWQHQEAKKKSFQDEADKNIKCQLPGRRKFGKS